jgi:mannose-6-phosphate isomerase
LTKKELLALRLHEQYPLDIGVLSSFLLNYVCLENGQAIALGPNEPHAYLSGEIVECMATSDNVIRAGLTPKYKDTDVLCSSLTYKQGNPVIISGESFQSGKVKLYRPDFDEFEVWRLQFNDDDLALPSASGPTIAFCQEGDCFIKWEDKVLEVSKGTVVFIPADLPLVISTKNAVNIWAAAVNKRGWW